MLHESTAQVSVRMTNGLSETKKVNNVTHGCAQQLLGEAISGVNVSQECLLHFWEAKEAESVTGHET